MHVVAVEEAPILKLVNKVERDLINCNLQSLSCFYSTFIKVGTPPNSVTPSAHIKISKALAGIFKCLTDHWSV